MAEDYSRKIISDTEVILPNFTLRKFIVFRHPKDKSLDKEDLETLVNGAKLEIPIYVKDEELNKELFELKMPNSYNDR